MKSTVKTLIILSCFLSYPSLAQVCNSKIKASTPDERFHDNGNGSVTDKKTGLIWSRCSVGQNWESGACVGDAQQLLWSVASLVATTAEKPTTANKWRLPELRELSELVELQCARPAINTTIFPTTPVGAFWTATRFANKDGSFWQVQFMLGGTIPERGDYNAFVRLVRDP